VLHIAGTKVYCKTPLTNNSRVLLSYSLTIIFSLSTRYAHIVEFLDEEGLRRFVDVRANDLKRKQGACVQKFVAPGSLHNEVFMLVLRVERRAQINAMIYHLAMQIALTFVFAQVTLALWRADGLIAEIDAHLRRNIHTLDQMHTSRFTKVDLTDDVPPSTTFLLSLITTSQCRLNCMNSLIFVILLFPPLNATCFVLLPLFVIVLLLPLLVCLQPPHPSYRPMNNPNNPNSGRDF
jgi:hypothetical protein